MIPCGFFKTTSIFSRVTIFFFQPKTLRAGFVLDKQKYRVNPNYILTVFKDISLNLFGLTKSWQLSLKASFTSTAYSLTLYIRGGQRYSQHPPNSSMTISCYSSITI